jgi:hypothetical protein
MLAHVPVARARNQQLGKNFFLDKLLNLRYRAERCQESCADQARTAIPLSHTRPGGSTSSSTNPALRGAVTYAAECVLALTAVH